ncbi:MAG: anti-sigma factor domain-containing protein [Stenotrophomonas maltophilia]
MSATEPNMNSHPDELLEAFALDALEDDEFLQVEQHLDSCVRCRGYVAQLHQTTSGLGLFLDQSIPPAALGLRIRQALTASVETAPVETGPNSRSTGVSARRRFTTPQWAMPLAAVLMLSLFSLSLFMNIQATGRMDQMERASSTVTAQLDQAVAQTKRLEEDNEALSNQVATAASTEASQMMDTIQEIRAASYLLALPDTRPLLLEPPGGAGDSQGVLLVEDKGNRAFLMISDMAQPPPRRPYQVWLVRDGRRMWAGQVAVDSTGWGSLALRPPEPVSQFEWVNLTMTEDRGSGGRTETMVLRSKIEPSPGGR